MTLGNPTREAFVSALSALRFGARAVFCPVVVAALAAVLSLGGCAGRKAHAFPWNTAVLVRPRMPEKVAPPVVPEPAPDLRLVLPEPSSRPLTNRSVPPRPHASAIPGASDSRPDAPMILPQLSAEESAAAQKQAQESLSIAQRNLSAARSRSLSAAQADLAGKIRAFIADAGEASRGGDWVRARNLAQKAQVLSEALNHSF